MAGVSMKDTSKKVCASFPQEKSEDGQVEEGKRVKSLQCTQFEGDYNFERKKKYAQIQTHIGL